jgi:hypothetical protein
MSLRRAMMILNPRYSGLPLMLLARVVRPQGVFLCRCGTEMIGPVEPGCICCDRQQRDDETER